MSGSTRRRNIKLVVAYNGAAYHGWQRQADGIDTVQQRLEQAVSQVVGHPVTVFGAGRTDAGVHAEGQVANFYTSNPSIPLAGLRRAINSRLPGDIAVRSAAEVPDDFHASRSARGKTYRYRIYIAPIRPVVLHKHVYHYWRTLDARKMQEAGLRLIGTHDFRGFATSADQRDNTIRTIFRCEVSEHGPEIRLAVTGDGFLYNMVRSFYNKKSISTKRNISQRRLKSKLFKARYIQDPRIIVCTIETFIHAKDNAMFIRTSKKASTVDTCFFICWVPEHEH